MTTSGDGKGRPRPIGWAVLGGFVLGASCVLLIVWLYGGSSPAGVPTAPPVETPESPATPAPAPAPALPPADPQDPGANRPYSAPGDAGIADLAGKRLLLPVQGYRARDLQNTFDDSRSGGRVHEAIDIIAPRNTPVVAVEEGRIAKLFQSDLGGLTIYQFDPSETYAYYYAHLERYVDGLKEGDRVHRGQVIGYVGTSGNAGPDNPHLHFAIFRLGPEKSWWKGTPVNPYGALGGR
ncbi:MAG TPA: M23 family metallopeptidase [Thermoanaerobaculia bacterium]|nr:M23 family metallopeptidase [Thermoanaerobaculia bacterium]